MYLFPKFMHYYICQVFLIYFEFIFLLYFLVIQGQVVIVPLPMHSYFRYARKRAWDPSRARGQDHHMQFVAAQVMVQHLVMGTTSTLLTMRIATLIHTQTLVIVTTTLFQVEYKTEKQSWLGLTSSHLMRWRCSFLAELQEVKTKTKL